MSPSTFLSIFRQPSQKASDSVDHPCVPQKHAADNPSDVDRKHPSPLPWIASPVDKTGASPHLYRHSDATPIELFFDLFFVANLSTFTATHEINNVTGMIPPSCIVAYFHDLTWLSTGRLRWISRNHMVYLATSHSIRYQIRP